MTPTTLPEVWFNRLNQILGPSMLEQFSHHSAGKKYHKELFTKGLSGLEDGQLVIIRHVTVHKGWIQKPVLYCTKKDITQIK